MKKIILLIIAILTLGLTGCTPALDIFFESKEIVSNDNTLNELETSKMMTLNAKIEMYEGEIRGSELKSLIHSINTYNENNMFPTKLIINDYSNSNITLDSEKNLDDEIKTFETYEVSFEYGEEGYITEININTENIENKDKKDINTIKSSELNIDEKLQSAEILKDEEGKPYIKISDSYVLNEKPNDNLKGHFFENEREILPSKIYLIDTNQECYYEYQGEIYYIPVEKCNSEYEERIVYQDYEIEVFKKDGIVNIFGEKVNTCDEYDKNQITEFENYFMKDKDGQVINKIYETDLDGNLETKEISLCYFEVDPGDGIVTKRMVVSKDIDNNIKTYIAPLFISGNINNFKNVFYINGFSRGNCINNVINEFLVLNYCIFDNENGFQYVWRFANGDEIKTENFEKLKTYEVTLNKDITFISTKGSYYERRANYTTWIWDSNLEEVTLKAGTKIKIVGIIDEYGNSIVMTEDGTRYEIANYGGIVESNLEVENIIPKDYLKLNNTSLKDLIEQKNINLETLNEGNHEFNLGKIKLNKKEYDLNLYVDMEKDLSETVKLKIETDTISNTVYEKGLGEFIDNIKLDISDIISILNDKYIVISGVVGGEYKFINIYDEKEMLFNKSGFMLDYGIENDKLFYQVYDELVSDEQPFKYYRAYYEIIEEDGELKVNQIKVDYDDIYYSAQTN